MLIFCRQYFERALLIWGGRRWFKHETARTSYLRGVHLQTMGGEENMRMGKRWVEQAEQLRREIVPNETPKELNTEDFDNLVCFWSR